MTRTRQPKLERIREAVENPFAIIRELNNRSLYHFIQYFFDQVSPHKFIPNWHIELLCRELEKIAHDVAERKSRKNDLIINVPPGTTKTITCSIMFPAWCWTQWPWMRFICASYSEKLALESAEYCRDLIRSPEFKQIYPDISIKDDKDTKSNYKIVYKDLKPGPSMAGKVKIGGNRYSTSVGGTLLGFHGDIIIVDDPLNPEQAASELELGNANRWMEQTLPTRKTDKAVTPIILIMQRLHQDDPSGHWLNKNKSNVVNISLPGEILNFKDQLRPPELASFYVDNLLDPKRMPWHVIKDMEMDLGQYGYAGQIGQHPIPAGEGMFRVAELRDMAMPHPKEILYTVRYWDKASTDGKTSAYTVGVKMSKLTGGRFLIQDVQRGRWRTDERERIILNTARADGKSVDIYVEQEPGSGGKDSAQGTVRNLAGFVIRPDKPSSGEGNKPRRADAFSVQVNEGFVYLLRADWNQAYRNELAYFPVGTYKDQVDASSGAFNRLVDKKVVRRIT